LSILAGRAFSGGEELAADISALALAVALAFLAAITVAAAGGDAYGAVAVAHIKIELTQRRLRVPGCLARGAQSAVGTSV